MHLIERWGTGMLRIAKMIREASLSELEILGGETELRFNIYRKQASEEKAGQTVGQIPKAEEKAGQTAGQIPKTEEKAGQTAGQIPKAEEKAGQTCKDGSRLTDRKISLEENTLLVYLKNKPQSNVRDVAQQLSLSKSFVSRLIQKLKEKNLIERVGSTRKGYWKVLN